MEWISVKEELPKLGVQVIILLGVRREIEISFIQKLNVTTAENEVITINNWDGLVNAQVTHWMPLPDTPKEGEVE